MEENIIVLKSAYGKTSGQTFHILPCKDPVTGDYPEHVRPCTVDAQGHVQMILSEKDLNERTKGKIFIPADVPIIVQHNTTFDLSKPVEKAQWEAIKNSKLIAPDRFSKDSKGNYIVDGEKVSVSANGMAKGRYGLADLYIEHPGLMAKSKNDFRKQVAKAVNLIMSDSLDGMVKKCRLLEKDMSHANSNDVEDYLFSQAEKNPDKIIDLYTGSNAANRLLVIDALEKNVLVKREGVIMYGDSIVLGSSIDSAIVYLTSPTGLKIKELIMQETYPELYIKDKKSTKTE